MPQAASVRCNFNCIYLSNFYFLVSMPQAASVRCNYMDELEKAGIFSEFRCRKQHQFVATAFFVQNLLAVTVSMPQAASVRCNHEEQLLVVSVRTEFRCRKQHQFVATIWARLP